MSLHLLAFVLLLSLCCGPLHAHQDGELGTAEGQLLPDLELPLVSGEGTLRLRGEVHDPRPILLVTFASW